MSRQKSNKAFPWDSFFNTSLQENAKREAEVYTLNILKAAAISVFQKGSSIKTKTVQNILTGVNKLMAEHPTEIETIKKETIQRFNQQLNHPEEKKGSKPHIQTSDPDMEIGEQEDLVRQLELIKQPDDPVLLKEKQVLSTLKGSPRYVQYTNTTVTPVIPNVIPNVNTMDTPTILSSPLQLNIDTSVAPNKEEDEVDIRSDVSSSDDDTDIEDESDLLDLNAECFTKQDYNTVEELQDDLQCDESQVCDISTKDCIDKTDELEITKYGPSEYTNTSNTNVDLITRLKEKFKQVQIHTPVQTNIQPAEWESSVIDMEETPAHVSERIRLDQYTTTLSNLQNRSRLTVDQRFNDRTKARRDLIRKCLNL